MLLILKKDFLREEINFYDIDGFIEELISEIDLYPSKYDNLDYYIYDVFEFIYGNRYSKYLNYYSNKNEIISELKDLILVYCAEKNKLDYLKRLILLGRNVKELLNDIL